MDELSVTKAPAIIYVILSVLAGGFAAFISLEAPFGIVLAVGGAAFLFLHARGRRWFALGGFLLGLGLCAAGFLSAALTNEDPAVTYDPSTIPVFWLATALAIGGAVTLAAATMAPHLRRLPA